MEDLILRGEEQILNEELGLPYWEWVRQQAEGEPFFRGD